MRIGVFFPTKEHASVDETVARMKAENPAMEAVTIPDVGHAPTLDEPESQAAIDRLLARVDA